MQRHNTTTERFPRFSRDNPARSIGSLSGPYRRTIFPRAHKVAYTVTLACAILGTIALVVVR